MSVHFYLRLVTAAALLFAAHSALCVSPETTTVNWSNFSSSSATQSTLLLRDSTGTALPQGSPTTNKDGDLVQLGFFSLGNTTTNFAGVWTPITGSGSTNHTSIGDSSNLVGSGIGVITFNTFFSLSTTAVQVYDPSADSGQYTTQSSISITSTNPPNNQVLAIRFYDTLSGLSGHYNTVSSDSWLWQTPSTSGGGPIVSIDFATSTLEFEDPTPANNFRTSLLVVAVPEPSSLALVGIALAGYTLFRARNRILRS
jgi:hypothetical protein